MKKTLFYLGMAACSMLGAAPITHYLEAEDFKGNTYVNADSDASGGKCVKGNTWYVFVRDIPVPMKDKEQLNCFVRVKSDLPANWFLAKKDKKAFGWFKTSKANEWEWVKVGRFSQSVGEDGKFPHIFLQKPIGSSAQTTSGYMDAIVFTDAQDASGLEALRKSRDEKKKAVKTDSVRLDELKGAHRVLSVPYIREKITLDGRFDEGFWKKCPVQGEFMLLFGKDFASQQTRVQAAYDDRNLYLAVTLDESRMPFIRKLRTQRNDSVWTDDCLELFFDPGLTQKKAFQLVVNPNGARQDDLKSRIDEAGFSDLKLDWRAAVNQEKDKWMVELEIPLELITFTGVKPGTVWGVNFCRSEIPSGEKSYWNNTGEWFLRPERYGLLHFGEAPGNLQAVSVDAAKEQIRFDFAPVKPVHVTASAQIEQDRKLLSVESAGRALKSTKETVSLPVRAKGSYQVAARVAGESGSTEFKLRMRSYSDGLATVLWPAEERDNVLPVMMGTVQHAFLLPGNHTTRTFDNVSFYVTLPKGVKLLDPTTDVNYGFFRRCRLASSREVVRDGKPYTEYKIDLVGKLAPVTLRDRRFFHGIMIFFKPEDAGLSGKTIPAYYRIASGTTVEDDNQFQLQFLPEVKGKQPEKLIVHNWMWTFYPYTGGVRDYLDTLRKVGFNSVDAGGSQQFPAPVEAMKKNRISQINNMYWHFNGGNDAIDYTGKNKNLACPTKLLAENGKKFLENRKNILEDVRKGTSGIVWDLEGPGCWDVCFCKDCIESFRKFAGIPAAEALTARIIRDKYNQQWISFCCRQSTLMSKALREAMKKINPAARFGFYSGLPSHDTMESYRANWDDAVPHIDLALLSYYASSPSVLDDTFNDKMKSWIKHLKKKALPNKLDVWATLTPGYERNSSMMPTAELVKLKVLRSFASGADGVSFWWWGPFDGKFYAKMAEATAIAADFEDFFLAGEKDGRVKVSSKKTARYSTFISRLGNRDFVLLMNHSGQPLTLDIASPAALKVHPSGKTAGKTVTIPALDAVALYSGR